MKLIGLNALILRWGYTAFHARKENPDFPKPVRTLGTSFELWDLVDIEHYDITGPHDSPGAGSG